MNGRLPPEVIQRIVRQHFGRFRVCYERGLAADPTLAGTVATKFVIDSTIGRAVASAGHVGPSAEPDGASAVST